MISKKEMLQSYLKFERDIIKLWEIDYETFKDGIELHEGNVKNLTEIIEMIDIIRECIHLLRIDGENTKKKVLQLLEEVIK